MIAAQARHNGGVDDALDRRGLHVVPGSPKSDWAAPRVVVWGLPLIGSLLVGALIGDGVPSEYLALVSSLQDWLDLALSRFDLAIVVFPLFHEPPEELLSANACVAVVQTPAENAAARELGLRPVVAPPLDAAGFLAVVRSVAGDVFTGEAADVRTRDLAAAPPARQRLTERERDVLSLLQSRKSNKEIAAALSIAEHTAKNHVWKILRKLGITSRYEVPGSSEAGPA